MYSYNNVTFIDELFRFMEKFSDNILPNKRNFAKILIVIIIFLTIFLLYFYSSADYVIIRFNELGALSRNMPAYYRGFKIGKIVHIDPDKDFKHVLVKINLIRRNINLPQNATVKVESFPNGELYLQFMYPKSPSLKQIQRGDILQGIAPYSLEQFMLGQNIYGVTDVVSMHVVRTLQATEIANQEIKLFFENSSKLVNENREGIKSSVDNTAAMTKSLAQMAENLNQVSQKINNVLDETTLKDTTSNIKNSTGHINDATGNISNATKDIGKTIEKIDDTISQVNAAARNLNSITGGLNETLGKRFGGMRVLFGTSSKQKNSRRNICR